MTSSNYYPQSAERFTKNTTNHTMTVLHDDGLYRHLRFKKPDNSSYWFDILTSPGLLTITGDMGTYVFSRTTDMFEFFRSHDINPGYWQEKLRAGKDHVQEYSETVFKQHVTEHLTEHDFNTQTQRAATTTAFNTYLHDNYLDVSTADGAHEALRDFTHDGFQFEDTWEWTLTEYTTQYLWCCHAIRSAIAQYDHPGENTANTANTANNARVNTAFNARAA